MRGGVDWMRKLAFRFRKIKENYSLYRNNVGALLGSPRKENWTSIRHDMEIHTDVSTFCNQKIPGNSRKKPMH